MNAGTSGNLVVKSELSYIYIFAYNFGRECSKNSVFTFEYTDVNQ